MAGRPRRDADPDQLAGDAAPTLASLGAGGAVGKATRLPMHAARVQFDREYICDLLGAVDDDVERAAALAELHPKSLERLMRRHGIARG